MVNVFPASVAVAVFSLVIWKTAVVLFDAVGVTLRAVSPDSDQSAVTITAVPEDADVVPPPIWLFREVNDGFVARFVANTSSGRPSMPTHHVSPTMPASASVGGSVE